MLKKIFITLFSVLAFCLNYTFLNADCSGTKQEASAVYEVILNMDTGEDVYVEIELYNLTENLYVKVLNDYNDEVKTYSYEDVKDGILTFRGENINYNINYNVKVYASDESCTIEPLKTINFTTKKFNVLSVNAVCNNPYEIELCNAFYDIGDMSYEEFNKRVTELVTEASKPFSAKVGDFIKKYYLFVLIPFVLIICVYIIRIIILKRGKKHD